MRLDAGWRRSVTSEMPQGNGSYLLGELLIFRKGTPGWNDAV